MPVTSAFGLPWALDVGDSIPPWSLPAHTSRPHDSESFVGSPLVFCFLPTEDPSGCDQLARGFAALYHEFKNIGCNVACVAAVPLEVCQRYAATLQAPFPLLADSDGSVTMACRAVEQRGEHLIPAHRTFLVDANKRVLRVYQSVNPQTHAAEVLEFLRGYVAANQPRPLGMHAPVLMVPRVFSPQFCRQLIQMWNTEGNRETGTMRERDGKFVEVIDHSRKIRRDHHLKDGPVKDHINHLLYHRVRPEIKKAFAFDVDHFEEFKIICYDSAHGGYFRPHRDNTTYGGAHRVFAMSLNLNTEEYEGGDLRFSEYGPQCYRPGTGEACIFSCTLLHEATDVVRGKRYALLAFLFGKHEAPILLDNRKLRVPGVINVHETEAQPPKTTTSPSEIAPVSESSVNTANVSSQS